VVENIKLFFRGISVKLRRQKAVLLSHPDTIFSVPPVVAAPRGRPRAAFSLIEMLVVMAIIGMLIILVVPAFTSIKSGTDVTTAANTIKGVLDTARTYAKANRTYTWAGFYEENVANPASPNSDNPKVGRLVMSTVASKDGTNVATTNPIDPTKLIQIGKLTKIDNVHLTVFTGSLAGSGTGLTFSTRPTVATTYCVGNTASTTPFKYPLGGTQYTFNYAVQFSSDGEACVNNSTNTPQTAAEVGLEQTHGTATPSPTPANPVAIQITGVGGDVTIYRK